MTLHAADRPSLVVSDLTKAFPPHRVLEAVSLTAAPGTFTVIGGGNGTGKSTLLRCVSGTARFTGTVLFGGVPITRDAPPTLRRRISYLPQSPGFPEHGTAGEVLELFARLRGVSTGSLALGEGFLPDLGRRIGTLSGGQQQRLALAIALLGAPELILLDEPVTNLDAEGRDAVWSVLETSLKQGAIVLVASPSPDELEPMADRVIRLEAGVVTEDRAGGRRLPIEQFHEGAAPHRSVPTAEVQIA